MDQLSTAPRQTRRFHEKREAILDAAARLFNQKGIKGATLSDVGAEVGLITNSVTYYYKKKEDLATACLLRSIAAIEDTAAQAAGAATPEARVRQFLDLHWQGLAEVATGAQPELISFNDIRALTPPHSEIAFKAYTEMFRRIRRLLAGDSRMPLNRSALNARAHLLLSLAHWARTWLRRYEPEDYARVAGRVADIVLGGLAAAGGARTDVLPYRLDWPDQAAEADVTPDAFLRAATFLVNEQGYRGASVDRISARLKVTKGSFYHHNDNKDDLIAACFEQTFAVLRRILREADAAAGSGWDRLCFAANALIDYQLSDHGPLLRYTAWSALPEGVRGDIGRKTDRLTARFASLMVDGMADRSIRAVDQTVAAQLVSGMVNAAAELHRWVPGVTRESASDLYARPLLLGLFSPPK
ncbi:MAG: TetR/AcrR family transcriptional regulator [Hyphomicrobiaceae bacterium]